jgi:alkyl hydroperoxide reductase subunit AhpF
MLSEADRVEVKKILDEIKTPVNVDLYTRKSSLVAPGEPVCETCPETEQILAEVAALNPNIKVSVHDAAVDPEPARKAGLEGIHPAMVFSSPAAKGTLRYLGIPAGYEFRTLLDTLLAVGTGDSGLSEPSKQELAKVTRPIHVQVYVTPG